MTPTKEKVSTEVEDGIAAYEALIAEGSGEDVVVELAKREILRASGFCSYTADPAMEHLDNVAIKEAGWQLTKAEAIVSTQDELDTLPLHRLVLASRLLDGPAHGTAEWLAQDVVWRRGWELAEQYVWKQFEYKYGATVQRWTRERLNTEEQDRHHVFVKTKDRLFITTNEQFVADAVYKPREDKLELLAIAIGTERALFERQMPALKGKGTSLKLLGTRVSKKARAAYEVKAALNGGDSQE